MRPTKYQSCERKRGYPTKDAAISTMRYRMSRGASPFRLHVYKCRFCTQWHIGHFKGRKRGYK